MKKKLLLILLALTVVLSMLVVMTACGDSDEEGEGDEAEFEYKASDVETKLDTMRAADGYFIRYEVTENDTDEDGVSSFAIGAKGKIYYIAYGDDQNYYDLTSDTQSVVYSKDGEGEWTKNVTEYNEYYTKEMMEEVMDAYISAHSIWLTMYDSYTSSMEDVKKSSATVAGRACDKYTFSWAGATLGAAGAVSYSCCVDKATSACLKWEWHANVNGEKEDYVIECKEFNTDPTFTLPTVPDPVD